MAGRDRIIIIKQLLLNEKKVSVADLSQKFSVTEETIRRDLDKLESEGVLTRTYGGAILNVEETVSNIPFYKRAEKNMEAKQAIAITARELLSTTNTMYADSSSTVMETMKLLKDRDDLMIVTNSSEALKELLVSNVNVLSTGGELNKRTLSLQGDLTEQAIQHYNVDVALISCKGIDLETGVTDTNEVESRIKRRMIQQASQVVLLADQSKFDKKAFVHLSEFPQIQHVITDQRPNQEWRNFFKEQGIKVHF